MVIGLSGRIIDHLNMDLRANSLTMFSLRGRLLKLTAH